MKKKPNRNILEKLIDKANYIIDEIKNTFAIGEEAELPEVTNKMMKDEVLVLHKEEDKAKKHTQLITMSYNSVLMFWVIWIVIIYFGFVAFNSLQLIYLILAAYIISMAMETVIYKFHSLIRRGPAIILSYFLLVLFVLSGFIILIPFLGQQITLLVNMLVTNISELKTIVDTSGLQWLLAQSFLPDYMQTNILTYLSDEWIGLQIQTAINENLSNFINISKNLGERAGTFVVNAISWFFSSMAKIGIVLILAAFFSIEKDNTVSFLAWIAGPTHRHYWQLKLQLLYKKLGQWLNSQLIVSLFIWTLVYIGLWVISPWINIDGKIFLALISALTAIIPYLGPLLWMLPALIAWTIGFGVSGFFTIGILYIIVQQIEGNFFTPFFMKKQLWISPVLIFVVVLIWWATLGFVWFMLAVPLTVIITLLFDEDYK